LALLSDWTPDPTPVGPTDFRGQIVAGFEGTEISDLLISKFFLADYMNALADAIELALDPKTNPNVPLGARPSIGGEPLKAVKAVDRPQRYLLEKYAVWYDPAGAFKVVKGQKVPDDTKTFGSLVFGHWKTTQFRATLPLKAHQWVSSRPPEKHGPIHLWNVPR